MRHLIIIAFVLVSTLWPFALKKTVRQHAKSLSFHLAQSGESMLFSKVVIVLAVCALICWYFGWYIAVYEAQIVLTALMCIMLVSCFLLAFIPLHEGTRSGWVHNFISYVGFAATMPFILLLFAINSSYSYAGHALIGIVIIMILLVGTAQLRNITRSYFLYMQAGYIFLFGLGTIVITYAG